MKKPFSYLWPFTKKYHSKYSGTVEVTWLNGKKVLDSKNANYSYGSLQRVLDYGLSHLNAERSAPVLVLGLGGGSVIYLLRNKFNYYGKITAVEIDSQIIELAVNEFGIKEQDPLDIVCEDAMAYIRETNSQFGLIIIDIFIDVKVPEQFYSTEFWKNVHRILDEEGTVLFNAGIYTANREETDQLLKDMEPEIAFRKLEDVHGTNTLLIGTKK